MVPLTYVRAIARAGARPLLIAPTPADLEDPTELLGLLDGVLITGGADVDPPTYGAEPHPETRRRAADRDAFELMLVRARRRARPPLPRHLPRHAGGQRRLRRRARPAPPGPPRARHPPRRRRRLRRPPRRGRARAASPRWRPAPPRRRQELPPPGRRAGRRRPARHRPREGDGTVEAIEDRDRRFMLGVLWHPEEDEADRLIAAFVRECRPRPPAPDAQRPCPPTG